ncbi:MAG: DUF4352 domain-containing protein [Chloroflexi bacterium]|nr:DUF4352 domain-containing protein [Chloroflexota bacterium]
MQPPFDPDRPEPWSRAPRSRTAREGLNLMWRDPVGRWLILGTGLITLFTCGVLVFALLLFGPFDFGGKTASGSTSTPDVAQTETAAPDFGALIISGELSVEANLPASLTLGEQPFALTPVHVAADGSLPVPADAEGAAYWIYGTLINYAIALPNTADNAVIMGALRVGDLIQLGLSRGQVLQFQVSNKLRVAPTAIELLAQNQPGLTLFLVGGVMTDRLVIQAQFVEPAAGGEAAASPAGLNEPRTVAGVTVSVQAVRSVARPSEVPPGWSYLVVDYTLSNDGEAAFTAAQANSTLTDARGQDYSPTFQALGYATYPPLPDQIAAGGVVQASVGYLVPVGLAGPDLLWRFYPGAASASHADFTLPYGPVSARIVVELTSAVLSEDGHDLNINGVIYNPSNLAATITRTDVTFRTEAGEDITLRFIDPSFPWTIGPQAPPTPFTLTYVRPQGAKATLRIFDFVFQINLQG